MNTTCKTEEPIFTLGNPLGLGVIDLTTSNITQLNM